MLRKAYIKLYDLVKNALISSFNTDEAQVEETKTEETKTEETTTEEPTSKPGAMPKGWKPE